jgi:hypothetical protein
MITCILRIIYPELVASRCCEAGKVSQIIIIKIAPAIFNPCQPAIENLLLIASIDHVNLPGLSFIRKYSCQFGFTGKITYLIDPHIGLSE